MKRNLVLKKVWNYSHETETHTVETHIHRLRKKILDKFGDNNFIKNDFTTDGMMISGQKIIANVGVTSFIDDLFNIDQL